MHIKRQTDRLDPSRIILSKPCFDVENTYGIRRNAASKQDNNTEIIQTADVHDYIFLFGFSNPVSAKQI